MIDVKGTKPAAKDTDPAEKYILKSDSKASRTPYVIGALMSLVALYLRSATSSEAQEGPGREAGSQDDSNGVSAAVSRAAASAASAAVAAASAQSTSSQPVTTTAAPMAEGFSFSALTPTSIFGREAPHVPVLSAPPIASARAAANGDRAPARIPDTTSYENLLGTDEEMGEAWAEEKVARAGTDVPGGTEDRNRRPHANRPTYLFDATSGAVALIALADLLENFDDPDGDILSVVSVSASSGELTEVEGGFAYVPDPEVLGPVQLRFTVTDGRESVTEVAHFSVVPNSVEGGEADDLLAGTEARDEIAGLEGADNIDGRGGADILFGGEGADNISGGAGDDVIFGGAGDDNILGGAGHDWISGGAGNDTIFGEAGNDVLHGDAGNDTLSDGAGADVVFGGAGDDTVIAAPDEQDDLYDGGADHDTLDLSAITADLNVDLVEQRVNSSVGGSDTIRGFETIKLGSGDDHVLIGGEEVTLYGGGGSNTFEFSSVPELSVSAMIAYQIMDFGIGDVIKTGKHAIFEDSDVEETLHDRLHDNSAASEALGEIRYRHESYDDREETILEWDDDDLSQVTIVTLEGHHKLSWTEYS